MGHRWLPRHAQPGGPAPLHDLHPTPPLVPPLPPATKYSELWQTGDCAGADAILAANYHSSDLLHGDTTHGLDAFRAMVETGHKGWAPKSHCIDVAVTPDSNKAFVHWSSTGAVRCGPVPAACARPGQLHQR